MVYAVIRIRGTVNVKPDIKKTLHLLNLTRVNHCVLIDESKFSKGMLQVVKDYVTWGEVEKDLVTRLLKQRGMLTGDKPLTDEHVQSATSFNTIDDLSGALIKGTVKINEIPELKKVFRLHPPQKGFEGIKQSFVNKGALGYRGKQMKDLLEKMI
jgi:large subunit ribosomal protein L30